MLASSHSDWPRQGHPGLEWLEDRCVPAAPPLTSALMPGPALPPSQSPAFTGPTSNQGVNGPTAAPASGAVSAPGPATTTQAPGTLGTINPTITAQITSPLLTVQTIGSGTISTANLGTAPTTLQPQPSQLQALPTIVVPSSFPGRLLFPGTDVQQRVATGDGPFAQSPGVYPVGGSEGLPAPLAPNARPAPRPVAPVPLPLPGPGLPGPAISSRPASVPSMVSSDFRADRTELEPPAPQQVLEAQELTAPGTADPNQADPDSDLDDLALAVFLIGFLGYTEGH